MSRGRIVADTHVTDGIPPTSNPTRVEETMAKKRKQRRCRLGKKSPDWTGCDVKDPGPFCKRCYHNHISP